MQKDRVIPFTLAEGSFRGLFLEGTQMVLDMAKSHKTGPLETLILGQAYLAGGLLGLHLKNQGRIQLKVESDGPAKGFTIEATSDGDVRGFLFTNPIPLGDAENLQDLMGPGNLSVTRIEKGQKQPFRGSVPYFGDPLPLELAHYYKSSEQTPTAFLLSLDFDSNNTCVAAVGLFVQAMPGCEANLAEALHTGVAQFPDPAKELAKGVTADKYLVDTFAGYEPMLYEERSIRFHCGCTKDQFKGILKGMSTDEKQDILTNGPMPLETCCFYCGSVHSFEKPELEELFGNL